MYNGLIIKNLLEERKIPNKELLIYLGYDKDGGNTSLSQIIKGNPTVKRLEPIADFFKVSMDFFFDRNVDYIPFTGNVIGNGNAIGNGNTIGKIDSVIESEYKMKIESLEKLIEEKDKRIKTLEELIAVLRDK